MQQAAAAADQFAALQAGERDLVNQLLGQAQMADAFAKFSNTVLTSKLAYVKENKLYQRLKGKQTQDGIYFSGTWAEFCNLLGLTPEHANESIANLKQFGSEALESMSSMGIGYRELRQYRKLPEDQQAALVEAAKAGDKDSFVDLAEEILSKSAKDKATLTAQVTELRDTLEAKDRVIRQKSEHIDQLAVQLARPVAAFEPLPGSEARSAEEQVHLDALDHAASAAYIELQRMRQAAAAALTPGHDIADCVVLRARQALAFLAQALADDISALGVQVDFESRLCPPWLDEEALAIYEQRQAVRG